MMHLGLERLEQDGIAALNWWWLTKKINQHHIHIISPIIDFKKTNSLLIEINHFFLLPFIWNNKEGYIFYVIAIVIKNETVVFSLRPFYYITQ